MNVAVIGLGSMGKRRIRILKELKPEARIVGVDSRNDRREEVSTEYDIKCHSAISDIEEDIDCAFICTSPLSHAGIITDCLNHGWHVFTELNLVDKGYDENIELARKQNLTLFLSSTFLYREETKYISSKITSEKKWNYIYHIGQYLPDWHPWENYKDFFVGDKKTNGCREIMAIELPWLIGAFGEIERAQAISDKITELEIGFSDNYLIQINHGNGNKGILIVDVVSPVAIRKFEAYSENSYYAWEGTPDSIREYNADTKKLESVELLEVAVHKDGYSAFIVENAYKNEIRAFFDAVIDGKKPIYDFEKDKKVLELIDSIGA